MPSSAWLRDGMSDGAHQLSIIAKHQGRRRQAKQTGWPRTAGRSLNRFPSIGTTAPSGGGRLLASAFSLWLDGGEPRLLRRTASFAGGGAGFGGRRFQCGSIVLSAGEIAAAAEPENVTCHAVAPRDRSRRGWNPQSVRAPRDCRGFTRCDLPSAGLTSCGEGWAVSMSVGAGLVVVSRSIDFGDRWRLTGSRATALRGRGGIATSAAAGVNRAALTVAAVNAGARTGWPDSAPACTRRCADETQPASVVCFGRYDSAESGPDSSYVVITSQIVVWKETNGALRMIKTSPHVVLHQVT